MNIGDIGIGLNAGISGFAKGLQLGQTLQGVLDKKEIRRIQKEGMEKAEQERQDEIDKAVKASRNQATVSTMKEIPYSSYRTDVDAETGALVGTPNRPGDTPTPITIKGSTTRTLPGWKMDGQTFDTKEAVQKHVGSKMDSVADRFYENTVPLIAERYMQQGNIEKAEAWSKYANTKKMKKEGKKWYAAMNDFRRGKYDKAKDYILKGYNEHYDDGWTASGMEPIKDKEGQDIGFKVKLTSNETGEVKEHIVKEEDMIRAGQMAFAVYNPVSQFEAMRKSMQETTAALAKKEHEINLLNREYGHKKAVEEFKAGKQVELEKFKAGNQAELEEFKAGNQAELEEFKLRGQVARDTAKAIAEQKLDDRETRRFVFEQLILNDASWDKKTPAQQEAAIDNIVGIVGRVTPSSTATATTELPRDAQGNYIFEIPATDLSARLAGEGGLGERPATTTDTTTPESVVTVPRPAQPATATSDTETPESVPEPAATSVTPAGTTAITPSTPAIVNQQFSALNERTKAITETEKILQGEKRRGRTMSPERARLIKEINRLKQEREDSPEYKALNERQGKIYRQLKVLKRQAQYNATDELRRTIKDLEQELKTLNQALYKYTRL